MAGYDIYSKAGADAAMVVKIGADAAAIDTEGRTASRRDGTKALPRFVGATATAETTTTPRAVDYHGGYFWGTTSDRWVWRSTDGDAWEQVTQPPVRFIRLLPTVNGEMLGVVGSNVYLSSGWAATPSTATWSIVLTTTNGANGIPQFGFDSDSTGTKFIAIEYGTDRTNSNKVYGSLDGGVTWFTAYDTEIEWPDDYTTTHVHSCCYDEQEDRYWFSQGHNNPRGLYYSDDDMATWTRMPSDVYNPDGSPIVLVPTKHGIVGGTDSAEAILWLIPRDPDPTKMRLQIVARWRGANSGGAPGGCGRGFKDPVTGLVYLLWSNTGEDTYPASMWVTDGLAAREVYLASTPGVSTPCNANNVVASGGVVRASWTVNGTDTIVAADASADYAGEYVTNDGNIGHGIVGDQSSVAVGPRATATSSNSVVIGVRGTVALDGVAIGSTVSVTGNGSVGIGKLVAIPGNNAVGIGLGVSVPTDYSTGAGYNAVASGNSSASYGREAQATAADSFAAGHSAVAGWARSVAFAKTTASAADQIQIGTRHIELAELAADPAAPAADTARMYVKDDGAGNTVLCVRTVAGVKTVTMA